MHFVFRDLQECDSEWHLSKTGGNVSSNMYELFNMAFINGK